MNGLLRQPLLCGGERTHRIGSGDALEHRIGEHDRRLTHKKAMGGGRKDPRRPSLTAASRSALPADTTSGASMNKQIIRAGLLAALSIAAPDPGRSADLVAGEALADKWCTQCHGVRSNQLSANRSAPTFPELAEEPSITEYSLRALLRSPHESMPQITFTPDQLDDVIGYIMSLKPHR
jgi:mono/diheme cytochrome c family protein